MKKLLIALAVIVAVNILDVITTWEIVCKRNGIELNPNIVYLSQAIGYIPTSIVKICINVAYFLFFYFIYSYLGKKNKISNIFFIISVIALILSPTLAVIFNLNTIINSSRLYQIEPIIQDIPIASGVEFNHTKFCRLT